MWNSIIKPALVLFAVCMVISASLAFVNGMTANTILENTKAEQEQFRRQVLEDADRFELIEQKGIPEAVKSVYAGFNGDKPIGFVMDVATKGYGGTISLTVGVNTDGQVTRVIVGANNETPGLGSKATGEDFTDQFTGIKLADVLSNELTVVKQNGKEVNEIQAVAGATISSRGITRGVQAALDAAVIIKGGD